MTPVNAMQIGTATPASKTIMSVRDLVVGYPSAGGWYKPVNGLSLDICEREVVGIVGDAGSGKSTAALAMMGLVRAPGKILSGSLDFGGCDLLSMDDVSLRAIRGRDISIIVQNPRSALNPMLPIGRQIGYAYQAHQQVKSVAARKQAIDMLRLVGINDPEQRVNAYAHELSGGMAQRALIAMALSSRPRLLIADEPTSGLDVTIQAQFLDEMWRSVQQTGSAILLVTQELGIIANYCDRVLVLHEGRIVENAPVAQFFRDPQHPYSRDILRLQREKGDAFRQMSEAKAMAEPLIRAIGLTKHFPVRGTNQVVQAVDRVDIEIRPGESLGLVGESGSGKTTAGRSLIQLLVPTAGQVRYRDVDLATLSASQMRRYRSTVQIVFQDPFDSVNPRWTVADILAEPLEIHMSLGGAEKRKRATKYLELVGLDAALLDRKPRDLGASTLQRVNVARALIVEPEFIVLDEPTSVLAPRARAGLIELLVRLQDQLGIGYMFISHDLTTVRYLCHRVAVMYLGQIVEIGAVDQVFANPRHPYSKALLSAHLFPDPSHRRVDQPDIIKLEGEIPSPIDPPHGCYLVERCRHATDICRANPQVLQELPDGHSVRCHRAVAGEI